MQGRSWMAALTLNASALLGLVLGLGLGHTGASRADDAHPTPPTTPAPAPAESAPSQVKLALAIVGLGPKGCDVEIAPGHMGCRFRPVRLHLSQDEARAKQEVLFKDIQITGADRYCMFAITIREPGQPVKTVRRGLRLVASTAERTSPQVLNCFLSSPSKLAKASSEMRERR